MFVKIEVAKLVKVFGNCFFLSRLFVFIHICGPWFDLKVVQGCLIKKCNDYFCQMAWVVEKCQMIAVSDYKQLRLSTFIKLIAFHYSISPFRSDPIGISIGKCNWKGKILISEPICRSEWVFSKTAIFERNEKSSLCVTSSQLHAINRISFHYLKVIFRKAPHVVTQWFFQNWVQTRVRKHKHVIERTFSLIPLLLLPLSNFRIWGSTSGSLQTNFSRIYFFVIRRFSPNCRIHKESLNSVWVKWCEHSWQIAAIWVSMQQELAWKSIKFGHFSYPFREPLKLKLVRLFLIREHFWRQFYASTCPKAALVNQYKSIMSNQHLKKGVVDHRRTPKPMNNNECWLAWLLRSWIWIWN